MKKIFFVTPIGEKNSDDRRTADFVMNTFLKPVADVLEYDVLRADLIQTVSDISDSVIEQLETSDLVIADISNSNPNVMFELGYRFALKKPYLILTQNVKTIPFDIRGIRALEYPVTTPNVEEFNAQLSQMIRVIESARPEPDDAEKLGEKMGADMLAKAIETQNFEPLQQMLEMAKLFGVDPSAKDE